MMDHWWIVMDGPSDDAPSVENAAEVAPRVPLLTMTMEATTAELWTNTMKAVVATVREVQAVARKFTVN
jgi:hypothetical protein